VILLTVAPGPAFEEEVGNILSRLAQEFPRRVAFEGQPRIVLRNGEELRPDFVLLTVRPELRKFTFIECQSRQKYDNNLFHKIQSIQSESWLKTFYVVTPDALPERLTRLYRTVGIHTLTVSGLARHTQQIGDGLRALEDPHPEAVDPKLLVSLYNEMKWVAPMPFLVDRVAGSLSPDRLGELGLTVAEAREVLRLEDGQEDQALAL